MKNRSLILFVLISSLILNSCRLYWLEKKLDEEDAEFLSQVRYIITKEERKMYLRMPKSERENFKKEFWKKRDTDPDTEMNEFKNQYFERMNEANRLFSAGKPGWLTDRGQTLILLGPPVHKSYYPMGDVMDVLARPTEIWHYPNFPVFFIDYRGTGDYKFYFFGLGHQADVHEAFFEAKKISSEEEGKALFDYNIHLKKKDGQSFIILNIEKRNLWMKEKEEKMVTTLEIELEIFNMANQRMWEHRQEYQISVSKKEFDQRQLSPEIIEISIQLPQGAYTILSKIKNKTDDEQRSKTEVIKFE